MKKTKSISINILSVMIILLSLFIGIVSPTNSWFTDTQENGVQIVVDIGDLKLKVYQNSVADANEIYSNAVNEHEDTATPKYVTLSREIVPGEPVPLTLILGNKDLGSTAMFVRFKFELFVQGVKIETLNGETVITEDDKLLATSIEGFKEPTTPTANDDGCGFVENEGYYYYRDNTGENALFKKSAEARMLTHFTVDFNEFVDENGNFKIANSETVYIKLTVQASVNKEFSDFIEE